MKLFTIKLLAAMLRSLTSAASDNGNWYIEYNEPTKKSLSRVNDSSSTSQS